MIKLYSIRAKMTVWISGLLILNSVLLIFSALYLVRKTAIESSVIDSKTKAKHLAESINSYFDNSFHNVYTLANILSAVLDDDVFFDISRGETAKLLKTNLLKNSEFFSIFTVWEPDSFDAVDAVFENRNGYGPDGRFTEYFFRNNKNHITASSMWKCNLHFKNNKPGKWYDILKSGYKGIYISDPLEDANHFGKKKKIIIITAPIIVDSEFFGVVGIEIELEQFLEKIKAIHLYNGKADVNITSSDGKIIASSINQSNIGHSFASLLKIDNIAFQKSLQEQSSFAKFSTGKLIVKTPVRFDNSKYQWTLYLTIPSDIITQNARHLTYILITLSIIFIILMTLFIRYFTVKITNPIQQATKFANSLSKGEFINHLPVLAKDETGTLTNSLNTMRDNLKSYHEKMAISLNNAEELAKTKSNFLASMSHEIRTPLNGVLGMAELLADTKLNEEQEDFVDVICKSGENLLMILNDILDYSKIEAGKMGMKLYRLTYTVQSNQCWTYSDQNKKINHLNYSMILKKRYLSSLLLILQD
jgi:methyl-accepting chemotaxis protein